MGRLAMGDKPRTITRWPARGQRSRYCAPSGSQSRVRRFGRDVAGCHKTSLTVIQESMAARRRNATGQGIHNKVVLAQIGGRGWVVVGSLNGGEVSAKLNRELALKVASDETYSYLADVF